MKDPDGNLVLVKDQDESGYITSLANSKENNVPVGMVLGSLNSPVHGYGGSPCRKPQHALREKAPPSV